ncbi:MAG TPA: DUF4180 domain-containing protein [Candidatus Cloacimonetes bacterium]|nr:DUF4180 domain-containing protein [Candidatus Cloacimonadota bacterium]HHE40889.1 DUF4180 domain-containing protein [Candidatus Cloacimonadota bacterium]
MMEIITVHNENEVTFVECKPPEKLISSEQDAVDLIGLCGYHQTNNLLMYTNNVDKSFFDLKSTLAGAVLQKYMNYYMRVALVLPSNIEHNKRFSEMALETNKGNHFRLFKTREEAVEWLTHG